MSKKNADREKEEEQDLDEDEDEEEEEEEEERPAAAKAAQRGRAHHAHDDHGHDEDEDEDASDDDDPYWWTPHAVLSVLVLFGVLGFFGIFNNAASKIPFLARPGGAAAEVKAEAKTEVKPTTPTPPTQREEFGAKHLLVQWKGSMRAAPSITRTEEEAKARATEALKKAKSGVKFEELVKEYSDEPNAGQRGGDLGKFRRGMMDPIFQAAVEKLKVGEVSDLVRTQFGYHIILRTL